LNLHRFTVFSTDGVSVAKNLNTFVLDFLSCLWSDQSEFMAPFMVFSLWMVSGFMFWVLFIFKFSKAIFLLLPFE